MTTAVMRQLASVARTRSSAINRIDGQRLRLTTVSTTKKKKPIAATFSTMRMSSWYSATASISPTLPLPLSLPLPLMTVIPMTASRNMQSMTNPSMATTTNAAIIDTAATIVDGRKLPVVLFPNLHRSWSSSSLSFSTVRWLSSYQQGTTKTKTTGREHEHADQEQQQEPPLASESESESESSSEATNGESTSINGSEKETEMDSAEMLQAQMKQMKDQLLRSLAEQENTRRIAARDVEAARQYAIQSFAKSLLEVSDNLTRAKDAVPEEMRGNSNTSDVNSTLPSSSSSSSPAELTTSSVLSNLYQGIDMTERGLHKAFEKHGLIQFGQPGDPFDPNMHEALFDYLNPNATPGTVGQVIKPGYMLNSRVLRPAEVGVIKK